MAPSSKVDHAELVQGLRIPTIPRPSITTRRLADHQNAIQSQEGSRTLGGRPRCCEGPGGHKTCSTTEIATCNRDGVHGVDLDPIGNAQLANRPPEERAPPITAIHQDPPVRRQGGQDQPGYASTGSKVDCDRLGIQVHRYAGSDIRARRHPRVSQPPKTEEARAVRGPLGSRQGGQKPLGDRSVEDLLDGCGHPVVSTMMITCRSVPLPSEMVSTPSISPIVSWITLRSAAAIGSIVRDRPSSSTASA